MLNIGRINRLKIRELDEQGAWFEADQVRVLLPRNEVPQDAAPGDPLEVFVYLDREGMPLATRLRPLAQVGEFVLLRVSQVTKVGAFLDWGLPKELLVPFSEQPERMRPGRRYLVKVCLDDLGRLVATARIDACLETAATDLAVGDEVDIILWDFTDLGVKVIIDDLYLGLLYQDEMRPGMKRGYRGRAYVKKIREDGKIDVTLRQGGRDQLEEDKKALLAALSKEGFLPLTDQSAPAEIKLALGMSKKSFKKALGGLYKAGRVLLEDQGIRLKKPTARRDSKLT